ncbi:5'-methylthioadenosine/S-adenosylhomocysteine nucleosidase [Thomasclavelia cocleata]|uniref:5'-methylthioadenosine/S-adenosylhomocysteine nucleosidase n=1 Tax=Thomasclavelia cocleata TaxID=69824 RepID=UPI003D80B590
MDESVQLFDTIISKKVIYHDVGDNILTDFHPWLKSNYFSANPSLINLTKSYYQESKYPLLIGTTVTGEQFVTDKNRTEIKQKYSPLFVNMETASIGHVCYVNKVSFITIRTITDTNKYQGIENFELNCIKASSISAYVVFEFLTKLATSLI